jgi:activating signal cointegrator 1
MASAISLYQPWAELVVIGAKTIETRSRQTSYRGELYIHATNHFYHSDLELCFQDATFNKYIPNPHGLRTGGIIGKVYLTDCVQMDEENIADFKRIAPEQIRFGNWKPGRWMYFLREPVKFKNHWPCRGQQLVPWQFDDNAVRDLNGI